MKLTNAKARLSSEDALGIIREYVVVEGLTIKNIKIDNIITVYGSYKKGVEIPFQAAIGIGSIQGNIVNVKIFEFKVAKVGILSPIKNFALKNLLKEINIDGITVDKDILTIDLDTLMKVVPYVIFTLKSVELVKDAIEVEMEDIIYAPQKEVSSLIKKSDKADKTQIQIADNYTKVRENIETRVPDKYKNIVEYALLIPDIAALLWRLFRDKRVQIKTKLLVGGLIAYIASPIDLLPDFIPMIGKIDDVAVVFFAMNKIINEVPEEVILANWTGKEDIIRTVKEGVAFIAKLVGSQNVAKLLGYIKKLSVKGAKEELQDEKRGNIH
ncbi:YkvA family protein [Clostridium swellfunianum]|uniref:YkvA family protein n=1 Tax=Clostridium swellfunianum TaxID=1367462 RepID=UPI00202E3A16|nr:YkvA family protein [Clostridium swellfunianum]MCM0646976.1 YkvA family protein [Clostridium swellfunianum]